MAELMAQIESLKDFQVGLEKLPRQVAESYRSAFDKWPDSR